MAYQTMHSVSQVNLKDENSFSHSGGYLIAKPLVRVSSCKIKTVMLDPIINYIPECVTKTSV
jgi:hypothetical protein